MKKILLVSICLFIACQTNISKQDINDAGKQQIGHNTYLKKIYVGDDRVYFLVNEKDELVGNSISTSYTISNGKSSTIKSNSIIYLPEQSK